MSNLDPTYLRYIYDNLIKGSVHPENSSELPEGLIGLYEEAFDERTSVVERQKLLERFAIWALLKKEVTAQFVAEVLNQPEQEIQDFISTYSAWFNSPESGKYQLYHERLKVYLLQKLSEGEVHKLTLKIFHRLRIHFDSTLGNEYEEYAQYYFLDYYNIVVNLSENLKINSELHQDYFISVKKNPIRLFYLENGRNHRERHLRMAAAYFSRKKDLEVLDELVHEINQFQNKRSAPIELSELIWSSNRKDQLYGYNLCSRLEDKLFLLVYSSVYHKELKFSEWHLEVIKEYWKELQHTKKIYELPSFFLIDLVPFLVDLGLLAYEEIEVKKVDFRLIHSLFDYTSFELFEIQSYNEDIFSEFSTASIDLLFQDEIKYRMDNENYFNRIDLLTKIKDLDDLKFLIDPILYFDLPSNFKLVKADENSLLAQISKSEFSEIYYNKTNIFFSFQRDGNGRDLIISNCILFIIEGKFNLVIDYLNHLKRDIKLGYTRDSDGATIPADDSWQYNEMIFSIFNFCLFREFLSINELEEFLFLVIKDDHWNPKYFNALYSFKYLITNHLQSHNQNFKNLIVSNRVKCVVCNYIYLTNNKTNALQLFSKLSLLNSENEQNKNYYEISFANCFSKINLEESILTDYYRNTNDIRSSVLPVLNYGILKNNLPLIWNFAHVNQSEMQKFGPTRSFAWSSIALLFSLTEIKFIEIYRDFLVPLAKSIKILPKKNQRKTSILFDFVEPLESTDLIELLYSLKKYFKSNYSLKYENLLFREEKDNNENLKNLHLLNLGYLAVNEKIWIKSNLKRELENQLIKFRNEINFINDHNHNLYLLNFYFDHPEYINSIAFYSELFKKYKVRPKTLIGKTRLVSNHLIEQLKWKDNLIPLEASPSNLMNSNYLLGQGYFKMEDYKTAIKFFKSAVKNRKVNSGVNYGKCFLELGKSYYYLNNFRLAIENLNVARINLPKSQDDLNDLSDCYYFKGLCHEELRQWERAIRDFYACRKIDKSILNETHKDHLTIIRAILRVSEKFGKKYHKENLIELIKYLKLEKDINYIEIGLSYLKLGKIFFDERNFKKAQINFTHSLHLLQKQNDYKKNISDALYFRGRCFEELEQWKYAMKDYCDCRIIDRKILKKDQNDHVTVLKSILSVSKNMQGNNEGLIIKEIIFYLKEQRINDKNLFKIASYYSKLNEPSKALDYYIKYLLQKSEDDEIFNLFVLLDDKDFVDFDDYSLIESLDFIDQNRGKKKIKQDWIIKLINLKNEKNKTQISQ